ncbi:hypothetical protein [Bradyrhizobium sp.]|uniref:hypothetical protein n=1 Tax=Bradyrhizobium sp. TaxID=376 RepID=UPI0039E59849
MTNVLYGFLLRRNDPDSKLAAQSRATFYVALTRARYSVAIAMDWRSASLPAGFSLYQVPAI